MYLLGFSLNNLSLMALTIATGFVVDDAIVMIENIARYIEEGDGAARGGAEGRRQIGFTIISLTVSLIAVLIPLLFMGDVVGRLFREFAITLAVTIVISAVVSLTLVPMMCAKLLRHHDPEEEPGIARWANEKFQALIDRYDRGTALGARPPAAHAAGGDRHAGADGAPLHRSSPRASSRSRTPASSRRSPRRRRSVSYGDMARRQAGAGRRDPQGPGRREPLLLHRRRRHQHHARTAAAC